MARHYGHGTPATAVLKGLDGAAFRLEPWVGHWTLLYFWADWCVPCVQHGIPELSAFVRSSSAKEQSQYRIVGIRFNSTSEAGDWNDFKRSTERLEQTEWHGVPPFPLVYDATTKMTENWGVHALPTYALVNPKGNLVAGGDLALLQKVLRKR